MIEAPEPHWQLGLAIAVISIVVACAAFAMVGKVRFKTLYFSTVFPACGVALIVGLTTLLLPPAGSHAKAAAEVSQNVYDKYGITSLDGHIDDYRVNKTITVLRDGQHVKYRQLFVDSEIRIFDTDGTELPTR